MEFLSLHIFDEEFAICLVDFKQNKLVISADVFRTKPIFILFY